MRHICFVRTNMHIISGASVVTANLASALAQQFFVSVVSIYGPSNRPSLLSEEVIAVTLNSDKKRLREGFFSGIKTLHKYLVDQKIDLVFSVGISPAPIVLAASRNTTAHPILIEHSNRKNTIDSSTTQEYLYKIAVPMFDHIITLTEADRNVYLAKYHLKEKNVTAIPNWVNPLVREKAQPCDLNAKKILSVGRITPVKGYDLLVDVAEYLQASHPDWSWDIFGESENGYDETIRDLLQEKGLETFVRLRGACDDIANQYRKYSIFVLTSYFEGIPLVLLEAQANFLPAVAFDCPTGPSEIIRDGINGYVIPCYNTQTMASKLNQLIENAELREAFSHHAQDNISNFSECTVLAKWVKLISQF